MTLSWSMDKLGPIARSVEDCALVFDAIHGADGMDTAAVDQPFDWPPKVNLGSLDEHSQCLGARRGQQNRVSRPFEQHLAESQSNEIVIHT